MHLVQRVAAIVLTLGLGAGLTGCGFHLKGTNPNVAPVTYANMSLARLKMQMTSKRNFRFIWVLLALKSVMTATTMCYVCWNIRLVVLS